MLSVQQQLEIYRKIVNFSDLFIDSELSDINDTLTGDKSAESLSFALDLSLSDEKHSELCEQYKQSLDSLDDDEMEDMLVWDFWYHVTGDDHLTVPGGVVTLVDNDVDSYAYLTVKNYAAKHGIREEDITFI